MKKTIWFLLSFVLSVCALHAQDAASAAAAVPVTLGQSSAALTGPWKFHIGDDPRWADPKFDDASWGTMDLTPNTVDPSTGLSGYVSG